MLDEALLDRCGGLRPGVVDTCVGRPGFFAGLLAMAASVTAHVIWEDVAMAWDFCTDPDVQARLDWADRFVAEEIEPVESLLYDVVDVGRPEGSIAELFEQWRQEVKDQ